MSKEIHKKEAVGYANRGADAYRDYPLGEVDALRFRLSSTISKQNSISIINWLDVESSPRYQPVGDKTFCNVYAYDYCYISGVYLPRVWGDCGGGYGEDLREMSSNTIYDWLNNHGSIFGWREVNTLYDVQICANNNMCALVIAKSTRGGHGHISVVVPIHTQNTYGSNSSTLIVQSHAGRIPSKVTVDEFWWEGDEYTKPRFWVAEKPFSSLADTLSKGSMLKKILRRTHGKKLEEILDKIDCLLVESHRSFPLSRNLIKALVTGEDRRFYRHLGFDLMGILRALYVYVIKKNIQGASTIEQQLVRTLTNDRKRKFSRKISEVYYSFICSLIYEKDDLAEVYIRNAYYGSGMNNFYDARRKLGFDDVVSDKEACLLISRLRYPQPRMRSEDYNRKLRKRAEYIQRNM